MLPHVSSPYSSGPIHNPYLYQGPYCSLCVNRDEYYNTAESACVLCKGSDRLWPLWVVLGALVALVLLGIGRRYGKKAPRLLQALSYGFYSRLSRLSPQLRLRAKVKQLITLCANGRLNHIAFCTCSSCVGVPSRIRQIKC